MRKSLEHVRKKQESLQQLCDADFRSAVHIDDVAQYGSTDSEADLLAGFKEVGATFVVEMPKRGMTLSEKSVALMPNRSMGDALRSFFRKLWS